MSPPPCGTQETANVRGQHQGRPELLCGQLLYPSRTRPCQKTRWPCLPSRPPPHLWGPCARSLHYRPTPTPTTASGSRPMGWSKIRRGARDCWLPCQWVNEQADAWASPRIGLSTEKRGRRVRGTEARSHVCSPSGAGSHLACSPSVPNLTLCTLASWRRTPGDTHQLVNHSSRVGAGAAELRSEAGSRVTAPNSREAGESWGSGPGT